MTALFNNEPLQDRRLFQTTELDEAREIVGGKFCDHRLEMRSSPGAFSAVHNRAEGTDASLNFIRYGADVAIDPGELQSFYLIQIPLVGHANINNGTGDIQSSVGIGSVLNPHRATRMRWFSGCEQLLLQIDAEALNTQAEHLLGHHLNGPVTFETAVDSKHTLTEAWINRLKTCLHLTEKQAIFGACNQATQMMVEKELITEFLLSQPSDISQQLTDANLATASILLRKAVRYIEGHLTDPISVTDIATAAGVTPRRMQQSFRQELNRTPMQYVRVRRLHLARYWLAQSNRFSTVSEVCENAGFNHMGRFSADYRNLFGEHPSETLNNRM